jgi:hypothetical protein
MFSESKIGVSIELSINRREKEFGVSTSVEV